MIEFLVNLVSPIFESMGASAADVLNYANMITGHIYAILAVLVVAIVAILAAIFVCKKGTKLVVALSAVLAAVLAIVVIANTIVFGPLNSIASTYINGSGIELSEETIAQSEATIQEAGEEGIVLVKNNGLLPLASDVTNLNVFGWASTNPLFGGTGSGSSDGSVATGILKALANAGYKTNEDLTNMYVTYRADRPVIAMGTQDWTLPEPTADAYTAELMGAAADFSDVAVIVIGRSGGEGADLPTDMNAVIKGTWNVAGEMIPSEGSNYGYTNSAYTNNGSYDDFDEGESYLELSNTEEDMIKTVCDAFDKVIVVINANNTMELGWVDEYPSIGAVLLAPGAGKTGFNGLGSIINGSVNPSGRTVDTFVKDLTATPTFNNFGHHGYTNVDDLRQTIAASDTYEGAMGFVNYVEGIYVGYKYYETASDEGVITFEDEVQYPFGYGLSYTTFEQKMDLADNGDTVTVNVTVTNTGSVAGKDVVELYVTPPYTNGGIEKASVNLVDFAKTASLEPGASETVTFEVAKESLASYDSNGIKVSGNGGYILEAGEYVMSVRSDSHTVLDSASFNVAADVDYSVSGRATDLVVANNQFQDYSRGDFEVLSRKDKFANYAAVTAAPANTELSDEARAQVEQFTNTELADINNQIKDADVAMPTLGAQNGKKLADYTGVAYDDPSWDELLDQLTIDDMALMINLGGWQTAAIESVGKPATQDCDGPAGLNNFMTGAQGSAFPAEVLMAQSWSKDVMAHLGVAMGQEYQDASNYGWYGPAMNTHRNAFAGRNFEYYSEDGTLAGLLTSAQLNAAAPSGVYPYIKHFALNDQETNRCSFLLTWSDEQAIREIYLKPFETAVKNYTGTPLAVMSSFNFIGTVPSCGNNTLLNNVLRDEWGFVGMVETDYNGSYGYMNSERAVLNGNDLMLGFGMAPSNQFVDADKPAVVAAMRQSCKNILYTIANSGYFTVVDPNAGGMDKLTKMMVTIDVIAGIACVGLEALLLAMFLKKKKAAK